MNFSEKLASLRKDYGYTQTQLAQQLDVSKREVVRWELGLEEPDRESILRISRLFGVPTSDLEPERLQEQPRVQVSYSGRLNRSELQERKSEIEILGLPLYHIGQNARGIIAVGSKASGLIAVGLSAKGVLAIGMLARGVFAFGLGAIGIVSIGTIALGLLAAAGAISVGILAVGALALGVVSLGAVSVGAFSYGALAVGRYLAVGDSAIGMIALGSSEANGSLFETCASLTWQEVRVVKDLLDANVPSFLGWAKEIVKNFL